MNTIKSIDKDTRFKKTFLDTSVENYYYRHLNQLSAIEKKALHLYQGVGYELINICLRNPNRFKQKSYLLQQKTARVILAIDSAFSKIRTPQSLTVYRGLRESEGSVFNHKRLPFSVIGPGFTSTTLSMGKALSFCQSGNGNKKGLLFKIHIPKHSPALWMDMLDDIEENEFLIARNSQYNIIGVYDFICDHTSSNIQLVELKLEKPENPSEKFFQPK